MSDLSPLSAQSGYSLWHRCRQSELKKADALLSRGTRGHPSALGITMPVSRDIARSPRKAR
jgi:hypothetical protein